MSETPTSVPQSIHERIMQARGKGSERTEVVGDNAGKKPFVSRGARIALGVVVGLLIAGGAGVYLYQNPLVARTIGQETQGVQADAAKDPFTAHAAGAGTTACTATYATLGQMLTAGAQFMLQTETAKAEAGQRGLQGLVGMTLPGKGGTAAGVVFAAPNGEKCEGGMVRVVPFAQSCEAAAALLPKGSAAGTPLAGVSVYALATGGQAMLVPAGAGCVAISVLRAGS